MNISLQEIAFYTVAACIIVCSVLAVTTGRILRAATYLLFVLLGTGALYGILGYTFLSAVQLMVYAGGIVVLYVFSILLTRSDRNMRYRIARGQAGFGAGYHAGGGGADGFPHGDQRLCAEHDSAGSGTAGGAHRHGAYQYGARRLCAAFRGDQRTAAGVYDRGDCDCPQEGMTCVCFLADLRLWNWKYM